MLLFVPPGIVEFSAAIILFSHPPIELHVAEILFQPHHPMKELFPFGSIAFQSPAPIIALEADILLAFPAPIIELSDEPFILLLDPPAIIAFLTVAPMALLLVSPTIKFPESTTLSLGLSTFRIWVSDPVPPSPSRLRYALCCAGVVFIVNAEIVPANPTTTTLPNKSVFVKSCIFVSLFDKILT
jgi:hypothetical protein